MRVLQLPVANLEPSYQIRVIEIRIGNQSMDDIAVSNGELYRCLVLLKFFGCWFAEHEVASVNVQYPVHPFEPLLNLKPNDFSRLQEARICTRFRSPCCYRG